MKSSTNADGHAVGQTPPRRQDRSTGGQPEGFDQITRVRDFHLHFFARTERSGLQLLNVIGLVHQQDVLIGRGLRFEEVFRLGDAGGNQTVTNTAILFGGEDVISDGQVVGVTVDKFVGEHRGSAISIQRTTAEGFPMIRGRGGTR